jgi:hypothetical protein
VSGTYLEAIDRWLHFLRGNAADSILNAALLTSFSNDPTHAPMAQRREFTIVRRAYKVVVDI